MKKYVPLIEINGNRVFKGSSWSVVCYSYDYVDANTTRALVRFFNREDAPNILFPGVEFCLYEGNKKVAFGSIIEKSVDEEEKRLMSTWE